MAYPTGTPVEEQILDDIKTALEAIAAPSYHTNVEHVTRYDMENGLHFDVFPTIVIAPAAISWDDSVHGLLSGTLSTTVRGFIEAREDVATELAWLAADIRKALLADYQRGGVALSTRVLEQSLWTLDDAAGPVHGIDIQVQVPFRHDYTDPNTAV